MSKTDVLVVLAVLAAIAVAVLFVVTSDFFGTRGPRFSPDFSFREEPRNIPRDLIKYRQVLTIPTGFASAAGLAVGPDDRIYVAGDKAVRVWDKTGKLVGTPISGLDAEPRCIAVDAQGRVFLAHGAEVEIRSPDGALEKALPAYASGGVVTRVVPDAAGVFVAVHKSLAEAFILRYDAAGGLKKAIVLGDMNLPNRFLDLAVFSDGLRVTDLGAVKTGRIRVYDFDGRLRHAWGFYDTTGDLSNLTGCCNPVHVAAMADGRLVTAEKGSQPLVKVYHKDTETDHGRVESVVAVLDGAEGLDLAVDSTGRILVLDSHTSTVSVFERKSD